VVRIMPGVLKTKCVRGNVDALRHRCIFILVVAMTGRWRASEGNDKILSDDISKLESDKQIW